MRYSATSTSRNPNPEEIVKINRTAHSGHKSGQLKERNNERSDSWLFKCEFRLK